MSKRLITILCMSLIALVSVSAMGASTAQAEWQLNHNEESVSELNIEGELTQGLPEIRIPFTQIEIHCETNALIWAAISVLAKQHWVAAGFVLTGCKILGNNFCTVSSDPFEAEGELFAEGEDVAAYVSAEKMSTFYLKGTFCTLPEELPVSGSLSTTISSPGEDAEVHQVAIVDQELYVGEEEATFTASESEWEPVIAEMQPESGGTWSINP